ncbi:SGNH/GDSL hydrolase family protein [Lactobacillus sp. ESL0684]|uniref:SGNH/GDSL hydrolase family protein n=1 Tax=Lactobacillus sp. ESL0684 TaxID=2983213 RepID=UPI0023F950D9|nr:SGNH/GDSL hydrolase family protein [Lactobacillus sp. ESL0684]WEV43825.1 SGNH/GDSL hydrolase family protein [Lactobacillus sp. ESL0684]
MTEIILFGDSIFNGYRAGHDTDLVTSSLQTKLGAVFAIKNVSLSGATTADGLKRVNLIDSAADIIVVEFGTNDMATWGIPSNQYTDNLTKIVTQIGPNKVIIVGPLSQDPYNKNIMQCYDEQKSAHYQQIAQIIANKYHIPFINMRDAFSQLSNISTYFQEDGLHLSDQGNELLTNLVTTAVKEKAAK